MTTAKRYTITKLAPSRFLGVREAARGLRVRPQSIYMYVGGWQQALGPKKRERLEVIDLTASGTSGHAGRVTLPNGTSGHAGRVTLPNGTSGHAGCVTLPMAR